MQPFSSPFSAMNIPLFSRYTGWTLITIGVAGFFTGSTLLYFRVSDALNIFYIATGILAVIAGTGRGFPFLLTVLGTVYALIAAIGLIRSGDLFGFAEVNTANHLLFILVATGCLFFGTTSKKRKDALPSFPSEPPPAQ